MHEDCGNQLGMVAVWAIRLGSFLFRALREGADLSTIDGRSRLDVGCVVEVHHHLFAGHFFVSDARCQVDGHVGVPHFLIGKVVER